MRGTGAGTDVLIHLLVMVIIVVRAICQGWQIQKSVKFKVFIPVWGNLVRVFCFMRTAPGQF